MSQESKRLPHLGEFRLEHWSVNQDQGTLCSEGHQVRLEPRVMDVLVCLAAEPGAVVSKEKLLETVWGGAFVEEGALAQAIHSLRKALGDDARQPRFIQTIPRRGYRLMTAVVPKEAAAPGEPAPAPLKDVPPVPAPPRWRARLLVGVALLGVIAILGLARARFDHRAQQAGEAPSAVAASAGRRIVVLPFENVNQAQDPYFAKGLTEEITNDLSSIAALEVISRTSAKQYEGAHKALPEIGRELKADYVLEGTVQWGTGPAGRPRVRIRPQLVRAADDAQVWAGSFDRDVADIFAVQSEISSRVIAQLGIALTPKESLALRAPPTANLEAYQAYLRGLDLRDQPFYSYTHSLKAVSMFERATELDPEFAAAWAELSQTHSLIAFNSDRSPARNEAAKKTLDRAVALDPDLLSVQLARIYFVYRCEGNYDAALAQLTDLTRRFPNDAEVLQTFGFLLRRKARFREAAEVLQRAFSLNPKETMLLWVTGETFRAVRNYEAADRFFRQAISAAPDEPMYWEELVLNRLAWKGDIAGARALLRQAPFPEGSRELLVLSFDLDFYERNYERALSRLSAEALKGQSPVARSLLLTWAAFARERKGDHRGALAVAEENRAALEDLVRRSPNEPYYPALLAISLAQLGRGVEACSLAEKTANENRQDALGGPNVVEFQAMTEATLGHRREAIHLLAFLLAKSYRSAVSVNELRLNPVWDSLRGDPEFEGVLRKYRG